jgi:hypothetical protein
MLIRYSIHKSSKIQVCLFFIIFSLLVLVGFLIVAGYGTAKNDAVNAPIASTSATRIATELHQAVPNSGDGHQTSSTAPGSIDAETDDLAERPARIDTASSEAGERCYNYGARVNIIGFTGYEVKLNGRSIHEHRAQGDRPPISIDGGAQFTVVEIGENLLEVIPTNENNYWASVLKDQPQKVTVSVECDPWTEGSEKRRVVATTEATGDTTKSGVVLNFTALLPYDYKDLDGERRTQLIALIEKNYLIGEQAEPLLQSDFNRTSYLTEQFGAGSDWLIAKSILSSSFKIKKSAVAKTNVSDLRTLRLALLDNKNAKNILCVYSSHTGRLSDMVPILVLQNGQHIYAVSFLEHEGESIELIGIHDETVFN